MRSSTFLSLAVGALTPALSLAQSKGFNYGSTNSAGACRYYEDFTALFNAAKTLPGANGFTSARLYTTVQCGTPNAPISAIQAAIDTDTQLLLGLWASAGDAVFNDEIAALNAAVAQYGTAFTDRVVGISVGSEDLYRSSPQGVANNAGVGVNADVIIRYINQLRGAIANTPLAGKPVGHVDTWTAWVLSENAGVAGAVDWLGHNSFPYFETTQPNNSIEQSYGLFFNAVGATESVSQGKPVWITETGWPTVGPTSGQAVASVPNAQTYWKSVGCSLFGHRNTWWYTLQDSNANQQQISFGILSGNGQPQYDLTCPA